MGAELERRAKVLLKAKAAEQKEVQLQQLETLRQTLLKERVRSSPLRAPLPACLPPQPTRATSVAADASSGALAHSTCLPCRG